MCVEATLLRLFPETKVSHEAPVCLEELYCNSLPSGGQKLAAAVPGVSIKLKDNTVNRQAVDNPLYLSFKVSLIGQWSEPKYRSRISALSTLGISLSETKK
jgi:hypothetical protein